MSGPLVVWLQLLGVLAFEAAIVIFLAARLTRVTQSAAWRRTIWQVCILSLLLLLTFELTGTARGVFGRVGHNRKPAPGPESGSGAAVSRILSEPIAQLDSKSRETSQEQMRLQPSITPAPQAEVNSHTAASRATPASNPTVVVASESDARALLLFTLAWLTGGVLVLGRIFCSRIAMELFRWRHAQSGDAGLGELALGLARRLGIRRPIRLIQSARFSGPITFGILRPTIGLPQGFERKFSSAQQEAMLAHELAHLAGHDAAWYLLADGVTAAFWWHPLVWWARRRLHAESEHAADEASLLVADGPGVLAECLVELGARLARRRTFGWMGVVGNGFRSGLGRRVERLVSLRESTWRPPNRMHCALVRVLCPIMLVATTILCTAWAVPQALTKGENMQTMKETWKGSLAAFALLTAVGTEAYQADPAGLPAVNESATTVTMPAPTARVPVAAPAARARTPVPRAESSGPTLPPSTEAVWESGLVAMQPAVRATPGSGAATSVDIASSPAASRGARGGARQALQSKLQNLTLEAVAYPGIPLQEVIHDLVDKSASLDPDKVGVNFLFDRGAGDLPPATTDPVTGAAQPTEVPDLSRVVINVNPALKHVRMSDLLDAITKSADHPIRYSIENYGVVFSLAYPERAVRPGPEALVARTFKVDTNTFLAGLENAFGIRPEIGPMAGAGFGAPPGAGAKGTDAAKSRQMGMNQNALRRLLQQLGVNMDIPNKSIYYNELTGIIMMRGTREDLEVFTAAIETLGGWRFNSLSPNRGGGF